MTKRTDTPKYETRQTGIKPGTTTIRSYRLWIGPDRALAMQAAKKADITAGAVTVTRLQGEDRQLIYTRTTNAEIDHALEEREAASETTINPNDTKGTSTMTTDTNTNTDKLLYTAYVWNADGKVKGKPKEYATLTGVTNFADKQSTTPGIREVSILGSDGSRRVSRHGETTLVSDDSPITTAEAEAAPAPAAEAKPAAKPKPEADKNPNKVAAAKRTVKPKVVSTVEQDGKPSAKVKLLDYKGSNTKYATTLPKGARWVAYDPGTGRQVVLAKKPTDAELANVKAWEELAMPAPAADDAKATEAA